jgi:peroxiredoxin
MKFYPRLVGLLGMLVAMPALAGIPDSPQQVQPLPVGARAPIFAALTPEGALRTFLPGSYKKPMVVLFYRGGWCPYCNAQLADLHVVEPRLRKSGFDIVFLSTDRPELLHSSLKATDIHYTLLSDTQLEAAEGLTAILSPVQ